MNSPPGIDCAWRHLAGKIVFLHLDGGHHCRIKVVKVTSDDRRVIGHTHHADPELVRWWDVDIRRVVAVSVEMGDVGE